MAVSIGTLRMDIIARTDEFEKGLFKTRKEMRATRRVFEKNLSVHDKYARSLNKGGSDAEARKPIRETASTRGRKTFERIS